MGSLRALIVGSDKDYCYVIKEFLDSRGMISSLILDYNQGIDKLFYENPNITVLELISSHKVSSHLINKVKNSSELQLIDFTNNINVQFEKDLKPVFLLEETSQLNTLLAFLNTFFITGIGNDLPAVKSEKEQINNDIESFPYPIVLSYIFRKSLSGILTVNSNVSLIIYFVDGIPVYAEGGDVETALGRMLMESGRIEDVKDYEKALNIASEKKQKLGEVLVSIGVLSPHELNELLENQIKEKIIRGFMLNSGSYTFVSGNDQFDNIVEYEIDLPKLLYEGIKRFTDEQFIKQIFFEEGSAKNIRVIKELGQKTEALGLGPKELRVIQNLEKNINIEKLLNNDTSTTEDTLKILFLVYLLGYVIVDKDPYRKISTMFNQPDHIDTDEYVSNDEFEDIIDLDEEIADAPVKTKTDVSSKKPVTEKDKEMINAVSKMDLDMEINSSVSSDSSSNVISFKEQQHKKKAEPEMHSDKTEEDLSLNIEADSGTLDSSELLSGINELYEKLEEDYYVILGVDKDSSKQEIRDRYYALVKKYHPDILAKMDDDIKEKADQIFSVITTAYQTLTDDEKKNEYDSSSELDDLKSEAQQLYQAELTFNEGAVLLKQKKYEEAEDKFKRALIINPQSHLYKGILNWTKFLKNKDDQLSVDECIKELEKIVSEDPGIAENYYYLGSIFKHLQDNNKAEINFAKAVEYAPDYTEAKRELRVLQNRKTEARESRKMKTEKRFWSSLFKK